MLKELEENYSLLEARILQLKRNFQQLEEDHKVLQEEYAELKKKLDELRKSNQELEEENKKIKLQATIAGNPEHNRLMKNHINRLIKEVDFCIAELQNNSL